MTYNAGLVLRSTHSHKKRKKINLYTSRFTSHLVPARQIGNPALYRKVKSVGSHDHSTVETLRGIYYCDSYSPPVNSGE